MNSWIRSVLMPAQGSAYAGTIDTLFLFLVYLSAFLFLLVAGLLAYFVVRYRRRGPNDRTPHLTHHNALEITWTVIPLAIVILIFFWGFRTYMEAAVSPGDSLEIHVSAKKWIWQFEYPNGIRSLNEVHIPVGKPVRFIMTSEDVIHSFFVPTMRVKQDVVPNTYTQLWFEPQQAGVHQLECAEYCGRGHSEMMGKIYVDDEKKYEDWLETGGDAGKNMPLKDFGAMLYSSRGCETCHSLDGTRRDGPSFKGIWGHEVKLQDGREVMVDENYVRESILSPQAKIVASFEPVMPTFQGLLREREINALIEFVKSQK